MKATSIKLYQIVGFDMERYIELYRYAIGEKDVVEVEPFVPMADFRLRTGNISQEDYERLKADEEARMVGKTVHCKQKRGVMVSTDKITAKCQYLQDAIIRRAFAQKDTMSFSLSSAILKTVLGHEYKSILETLATMGYLRRGSDMKTDEVRKDKHFSIGDHSTMYTLVCDAVETIECSNVAIIKYKEKTKAEYEKLKEMALEEVDKRYGKTFREHYVKSLRKIGVEDEDGMMAYIEKQVEADANKTIYYRFVVEALKDKNKSINKIDNAGRVYHCLTNLERELKQYLNIDLMLDCKNSHPLLFNYFILKYYNISISSSYNIIFSIKSYHSLISANPIHNVGKYLRKLLIDNEIENDNVAKMSDDELEYIYLTSTGRLWDEMTALHPDMDRNEVKVQMFQEVFYSNSPYAYHWKQWAVEFKKRFPTVYKRIGEWKSAKQSDGVKAYMEERGLTVDKPTASLSVAMMDLEARIFTTILKRLYAKRWNAIHIHDCIVIPKDGNANHPTEAQVRSVMEDVYKDFGLSPTVA